MKVDDERSERGLGCSSDDRELASHVQTLGLILGTTYTGRSATLL